jgi:hypothetical protein
VSSAGRRLSAFQEALRIQVSPSWSSWPGLTTPWLAVWSRINRTRPGLLLAERSKIEGCQCRRHRAQVELGLAIAPNGGILTVNADHWNLVETPPAGISSSSLPWTTPLHWCRRMARAPCSAGRSPGVEAVYFMDDDANTLNLLS